MLWDHCMVVIMYTKGYDEQDQETDDIDDPVKFIGFYYADVPEQPVFKPSPRIMGLIPTREEVKKFPVLEKTEDTTRENRPSFLSFTNFADAMVYLGSTGWEAVSHSKVIDRYGEDVRLQIHENYLFKRRVR